MDDIAPDKIGQPSRSVRVFAPRVIRLMAEVEAAQTIGVGGFALIAYVICRQDDIGYGRPFVAYNSQMCVALGISDNTLKKTFETCATHGWLKTEKKKHRGQRSYEVRIPLDLPQHLLDRVSDYLKICGHEPSHDRKTCGHENSMAATMTSNSAVIVNSDPHDRSHDRSHDLKICGPPTPTPIPKEKEHVDSVDVSSILENKTTKKKRYTKTDPAGYSPEFERFYANWPKKDGKRNAQTAFNAATERIIKSPSHPSINSKDEAVEFLNLKAIAFARQIQKSGTDPKFIPLPASWLNADRFDDESLIDKSAAYRAEREKQATERLQRALGRIKSLLPQIDTDDQLWRAVAAKSIEDEGFALIAESVLAKAQSEQPADLVGFVRNGIRAELEIKKSIDANYTRLSWREHRKLKDGESIRHDDGTQFDPDESVLFPDGSTGRWK